MTYKQKLIIINDYNPNHSDDIWYLVKDLLNVITERQAKKIFKDGTICWDVALEDALKNKMNEER